MNYFYSYHYFNSSLILKPLEGVRLNIIIFGKGKLLLCFIHTAKQETNNVIFISCSRCIHSI